jgi:cobyrinic acid a,c-diamide synthase
MVEAATSLAPAGVRVALVSAAASGQGKTSVTSALARRLRNDGMRVRVFKTGPDFLDPMVLERASGAPVHSLDLWINGETACRRMLAEAAQAADVVLIEGVMGLYDGPPSSADLARAFGVPVIAVIDASAMAQTAGALALGLRDYGPVDLGGVIANRVAGSGHATMVAASLRDIPLLGSLPRQEKSLPERHLGLLTPDEMPELDARLDRMAREVSLNDSTWASWPRTHFAVTEAEPTPRLLAGKTIAIARDAAFAFLYRANLDCLEGMGAKLRFFSPLANQPVPEDADALYLPGGYPELHGEVLASAQHWFGSVHTAHRRGMPIWAECGGMMALCDAITDQHGRTWPMAGILPGTAVMQPRLAGIGSQALSLRQGELRGHTFHYSRLENAAVPAGFARRYPSDNEGEALYRSGSLVASYFHAWFPSCPQAAAALFIGDGEP